MLPIFWACTLSSLARLRLGLVAFQRRITSRIEFIGAVAVSTGAVLLRTSDLKQNLLSDIPSKTPRPYMENGAGPDVLILLSTASAYPFIRHLPEPLVFFREHAQSFSIEKIEQVNEGNCSAIRLFLVRQQNSSLHTYWMKFLAHFWLTRILGERQWFSPGCFIEAHEGRGNTSEILVLI